MNGVFAVDGGIVEREHISLWVILHAARNVVACDSMGIVGGDLDVAYLQREISGAVIRQPGGTGIIARSPVLGLCLGYLGGSDDVAFGLVEVGVVINIEIGRFALLVGQSFDEFTHLWRFNLIAVAKELCEVGVLAQRDCSEFVYLALKSGELRIPFHIERSDFVVVAFHHREVVVIPQIEAGEIVDITTQALESPEPFNTFEVGNLLLRQRQIGDGIGFLAIKNAITAV